MSGVNDRCKLVIEAFFPSVEYVSPSFSRYICTWFLIPCVRRFSTSGSTRKNVSSFYFCVSVCACVCAVISGTVGRKSTVEQEQEQAMIELTPFNTLLPAGSTAAASRRVA